jgi:hypothetical protein
MKDSPEAVCSTTCYLSMIYRILSIGTKRKPTANVNIFHTLPFESMSLFFWESLSKGGKSFDLFLDLLREGAKMGGRPKNS